MQVFFRKKKPYHLSLRSLTGVTEYRFAQGDRELGGASAHSLRPVELDLWSGGRELHCQVDMEITICPGNFRSILRPGTGEEYARVIYRGEGHHSLELPLEILQVRHREGRYEFFHNGKAIAEMHTLQKTPNSRDDEWEPRQALHVKKPISDELAMLMLAFPLVQIGW